MFDEVDAGIGGAVAEIVGRQLRALGSRGQVLCVTHLPQVASQGHHHLRVVKLTDGKTTRTSLVELAGRGARAGSGAHAGRHRRSRTRRWRTRAKCWRRPRSTGERSDTAKARRPSRAAPGLAVGPSRAAGASLPGGQSDLAAVAIEDHRMVLDLEARAAWRWTSGALRCRRRRTLRPCRSPSRRCGRGESPRFSSNTAMPFSKWWRVTRPAASNCVSTRYTVASPMSSLELSSAL